MIPQTFQAFLMVEDVATAAVTKEMLFGFQTATATEAIEEISSITCPGLLATEVYRTSAFAEYGTYSIGLETGELSLNPAVPATTSKNWTIEWSMLRVDYGAGVFGGGPAIEINSGADGFQITADLIYDPLPPFDPFPAIVIQDGAGSLPTALVSDAMTPSTWVKFALVLDKDANTLNLYQAGSLVDSVPATSFSGTPWAIVSARFGHAGALYNSGTPFYLDNILISAGVKYTGASYTLPVGPFTP